MSEFDYIVIGSGSGGAVVASRLSEDPGASVLVLESGGSDWNPLFRMGISSYRGKPAGMHWGFASEPEPHLGGRTLGMVQGHLMGGSSSLNGNMYSRGHPDDYNEWEELGCKGWSFADVLPYFKRAEGSWRGNGPYHSAEGPLKTTPAVPDKRLQDLLLTAAASSQISVIDDVDAEPFCGLSRFSDLTVDAHGHRSSTARAYLRPALKRRNLKLLMKARVTRIIVEDGQARGVEFIRNGSKEQARARKEVVLCSGVFNTARLLLLSGIGAADELSRIGIEPLHDLPGVGKNISDHAGYTIGYDTREPVTALSQLRFDRVSVHFLRWLFTGTGPFSTQPLLAQGLLKTLPALSRPDIQAYFIGLRRDAEIWFPLLKPEQPHRLESTVVLLHPHSRGSLTLASADPREMPRIQLNLLADQRDIDTILRGLKLIREVYRTSPLAALIGEEVSPGRHLQSDADLTGVLRQGLITLRHPVGSCRMGGDELAVVDSRLRVRGIAGLRIADASVMPRIPGGNTNAPVIMIAEKAVDMILGRPALPTQQQQDH